MTVRSRDEAAQARRGGEVRGGKESGRIVRAGSMARGSPPSGGTAMNAGTYAKYKKGRGHKPTPGTTHMYLHPFPSSSSSGRAAVCLCFAWGVYCVWVTADGVR